MNNYKIVTIRPSSNNGVDWRNLFSTIMNTTIPGDRSSYKYITGDNSFDNSFEGYDVDSSIDLVMGDNMPSFGSSNEYDSAIKSALSMLDSFKIPASATFNTVMNLATGMTNLANAFQDEKNANEDKSGYYNNITASFNPWVTTVPSYKTGSANKDISYKFEFHMGQYGLWDARKEVVNPIINLMAPTLPRMLTHTEMVTPFPNQYQIIKNIFKDFFTKNQAKNQDGSFFERFGKNMLNFYNGFTYDVSFGNLYTFHNMLIKNCTVNFSSDTDQYGNPIYGSIELMMSNIIPPALAATDGALSLNMKGGK